MYKVSEEEQDKVNYYLNALRLLYGELCVIRTSYVFTKSGAGTSVEVEFEYKAHDDVWVLRHDITDYNKW